MAYKTFLDLTNEVIDEIKVSIDPLIAGNFVTPPRTAMYNRVKKWVNRAYSDIVSERHERFFRIKRTTVTIYPRISLTGLGGNVIAPGNVLQGDSSKVKFTVVAVHPLSETNTSPLSSEVQTTVSVTYDAASNQQDLLLNETINRLTPVATPGIAVVKGRGRYSFPELVPTLDQIMPTSALIQPMVKAGISQSSGSLGGMYSIGVWPWDLWNGDTYFAEFNQGAGRPIALVRAPDGMYDFYPHPDQPYNFAFDYSNKYADLEVYSDTPVLIPEKSQDLIVWRAVQYYADWDGGQAKLWASANKNVVRLTYELDRDQLAQIGVALSRFDY